jgi:hypothetical protein
MWLVPEPGEQAFKEPLRSTVIPPVLHQDVEHEAVVVHRTPKIVQDAADP